MADTGTSYAVPSVDETELISLFVAVQQLFGQRVDRSEGQPFAVLDALTAGRPVVSTAAGDVPHLLARAGPAGIVVPIGDASAVASSVVSVLQWAPSVDVKAAARRVVAELPSEHEHAATYGGIYELAVAGRTDVLATERIGAIPGDGNRL